MKKPFHLRSLFLAAVLLCSLAAGNSPALAQDPGTNAAITTAPAAPATPTVPAASPVSAQPTQSEAAPASAVEEFFRSGQAHPAIFSNYLLNKGETNFGDAVAVKGNSTINGVLEGDSVTVLGNAMINGKVTGHVVVVLGSLTLGAQAEIGGNVVVAGGKLERAPGAKIKNGDVEVFFGNIPGFNGLVEWVGKGLLMGRPFPPGVGWVWMVAGICLGINLLLLLIFPRPIQACVDTMEGKPVTSFFVGILAKLLAGLLTVLLVVSLVGIIALPFLCAAYWVAVLFGKITTYRYVGQQLGRLAGVGFLQAPAVALIVGTAVFYLLYMVPYLGFVAWGFSGTFGLGAVALATFQQFRAERPKPTTAMPAPPIPPASVEIPAAAFPGAPSFAPGAPAATSPPQGAYAPMDSSQMARAGFWVRFFALALDAVMFFIVFGVFGHRHEFFDEVWFGLGREDFCMILWLLYHVFLWTWKGTTIGGIVMGIKVVRLDGRPMDFPVALIRALASVLSFFVLGLGFFWAGISNDKQSWHDKIAGTVMVRVPRGMSLV